MAACAPASAPTGPVDTSGASRSPIASVEPVAFGADPDRLRGHLSALQEVADAADGIRASGTAGYAASVEWASAALADLGFAVETPAIEFTSFRELPGSTLEVGSMEFRGPDELHALIYSPGGSVRGPVTVLAESGCEAEHFDAVQRGAIVLTVQGGCFRREQAINAATAGAAAFLVGYPGRGPGEIFRPTLIDPGGIDVPVVSVTDAAVQALEAREGREIRLEVATEMAPATFRNVIGRLGDGPRVLVLGAHLDSVLDGPGLNDNGSGVAAVLEVARGIAELGVPAGWSVRIGLWGGEEFGTIGSRANAASIGDEVEAYLNLDMAGSVNGANLVYDEAGAAPGSSAITELFGAWFAERGEPSAPVDLGGSSDQYGFQQAGVPTGGLFAGASETGSASQPSSGGGGVAPDPCYHLACDDLDNVDLDRVALFAEATLAVAYALMGGTP